MPDAYAEINGESREIAGGSYTVGWGTPPGVCGLAVGFSFASAQPGQVVTLEIKFRGRTIKLRDALVVDPRVSGGVNQSPVVNFSVLDRRWRWLTAGRINGSYNVEKKTGALLREKNPQQLAELLYVALGEETGTFDVGALPTDPRPLKAWDAADPRAELEELCAEFGCVPIFDPITDKHFIVKIGDGGGPPDGTADRVISLNQSLVTPAQPSGFRGVGAPVLFQTVLALGAPVGREVTGAIRDIHDLSYKPAGGWQSIDPWDFKSLNSEYTDPSTGETLYHRDLAMSSVWRMYRISGQVAGGFAPQSLIGSPYAPASIADLGPFTGDLLDRDAATDERLPAYVRGVYADERLGYDNSKPKSRFPGSVTIDSERRIVTFDRPLFKYGVDGRPYRADVELIAAYACSKDGVPIRWEFSQPNGAGGLKAGEAVEVRDEVIREIIEQSASTTGLGRDNVMAVNNELRYYLDAMAGKFRTVKAANVEFGGLHLYRLSGQLRSITWQFSANDVPTTQCSWNSERSTAVIPWDKRNEARQLRRGRFLLRTKVLADRVRASRESAKKTT